MNHPDRALKLLALLPKALHLVWRAAPAYTAAWLLLLVVQGLLPGATVYLTKLVLDGAEVAFRDGEAWENMRAFLIPAALLGGAMLVGQVFSSVQSYVQVAQTEHLQDHVQGLIQSKAIELDYAFFDASESYDLLERASGGGAAGCKSC